MSDLRELYQEVILDHYRRPRNFREAEGATQKADGFNPLCGDRITVFIVMEGDTVRDVSFKGTGCAISTASASLMTETLKGKTRAEAEALFARFHELVAPGAANAAGERKPEPSVPAAGAAGGEPGAAGLAAGAAGAGGAGPSGGAAGGPGAAGLGKLAVFSGVREFPARVKCATLAWHAFHAALEGRGEPVSTE